MPAVATTQENDELRPHERDINATNQIDEALAWHGGDARATITTLLSDCRHLRTQLAMADQAMSRGFTRGWRPQPDRDDAQSSEGA